jgi:hypothetical protein
VQGIHFLLSKLLPLPTNPPAATEPINRMIARITTGNTIAADLEVRREVAVQIDFKVRDVFF